MNGAPLGFALPWLLLLLPLAALPWRRTLALPRRFSSLMLLPPDPAAAALQVALKLLGTLAIGALVLGLAGLQRGEQRIERQGQGAEIVLLLDRSRSMDQGFVSRDALGSANPSYYNSIGNERGGEPGRESKAQAARRVLAEFTARRRADRFGMLLFSAQPIRVLDFTEKPDVVQAAIAAADIGRGLADTDISSALFEGLAFFDGRAYTGSRILLLVSDGGDHIDPDARDRLQRLMRQQRVALYWIYIRSLRSPGLAAEAGTSAAEAETVPEIFLHRFFGSLGILYRAYEADSQQALQRAIDDVDRLENLPITTVEVVPRQPLASRCFAVALLALLLLLLARLLEPWPEPAR